MEKYDGTSLVIFEGTKDEVEKAYGAWIKENTGVEIVNIVPSETRITKGYRMKYIHCLAIFYRFALTSEEIEHLHGLVPGLIENELNIKKSVQILEKALIEKALKMTKGNKTHARKLLGISHRALLYKIPFYGIKVP